MFVLQDSIFKDGCPLGVHSRLLGGAQTQLFSTLAVTEELALVNDVVGEVEDGLGDFGRGLGKTSVVRKEPGTNAKNAFGDLGIKGE